VEHHALVPRPAHRLLVARDGALVDDRPEEDVALGRIAHAHGPDPGKQPLGERRRDVAVDVDPAGRAAFLVLQAEGRAHHAFRRGIQVRRGHHDRGVLAAQLQQARLDETRAEPGVDPEAHGLGARKDHPIHSRVLPQGVADRLTASDEEVEHAGWNPRVPVDLIEPEAGERSVLGGLVDHGVAGRERGGRHAGGEREGKVEGRDAGEHAVRAEQVRVPLDRRDPSHRAHEPVGLLHLGAIVVDQVGRLLRVAHRLEPALADLEAHERRQGVLPVADQACRAPQGGETVAPRLPGPVALRPPRRDDGPIHILHGGHGEPAEHHPGVDGRTVVQGIAAPVHGLAPDVEWVAGARRAPDFL
jgi:hypothetical protein